MCYGPDIFERQGLEFVLLQKVVQILLQHFKHQTCVVFMGEALIGSNKIVFVSIFLG